MPDLLARGFLAALALGLSTSLQGCAVKFLNSKTKGGSPLEVCPAFKFAGNGYVSEARAGDIVNITCPTDFTYHGPAIECSWVDKFCVAYGENKINPEFCYNQYNLTLAGQGLTDWPDDVDPKIMPPPTAGNSMNMGGANLASPAAAAAMAAATNASRMSKRGRLTTALPQLITPDHLSCKDETWADLDFEMTVVDHSQQIDDKYPWSLRYREITTVKGQKVDLLVTTPKNNISGFSARTGKGSAMGRININCTNTVPLKFQFVKTLTDQPQVMSKVFFTVFDIVDASDPKNDKSVTLAGMQEYFVTQSTRVSVEPLDNGEYTFGRDPLAQNAAVTQQKPFSEMSVKEMWSYSVNSSVVFMFRNTSEFMLYVKVTPGPEGRDFEFTGWSEVAQIGRKVFSGPQKAQAAKFSLPEKIIQPRTETTSRLLLAGTCLNLVAVLGGVAAALRTWSRSSRAPATDHDHMEPAPVYTAYPCKDASASSGTE